MKFKVQHMVTIGDIEFNLKVNSIIAPNESLVMELVLNIIKLQFY